MTLRLVDGGTAALGGGEPVTLIGSVLNMSTVADTFSDGTIGALWTSANAGTGRTLELGSERALYFDTGATAASTAGLRSVASLTNLDVEFTFRASTLSLPRGGTARIASFALFVSSGNEVRLDVEATRTARVLHVIQRVTGATVLSLPVTLANANEFSLRWIRVEARVLGFLNGREVVDSPFVSTAAQLEFIVSNDAALSSSVVTRVTRYLRRPLVVVESEPVRAYEDVLTERLVARVPARAVHAPDTVDLTVYGASTTETLAGAVTYLPGDPKVIGRDSTKSLVVADDAVLRGS